VFLTRIERANIFQRGKLHIIKLMLSDGTGRAQLFLFNRPYLAAALKTGLALLIRDVPERALTGIRFSGQAGTVELVGEGDVRRIEAGETVVFYRATTVIPQARARQLAAEALEHGLPGLRDPLPAALRARHALRDPRRGLCARALSPDRGLRPRRRAGAPCLCPGGRSRGRWQTKVSGNQRNKGVRTH
jgi:RecG-like helicase